MLKIVAPHPCYGCGKIGLVLCDYCKYDIIFDPFSGCILCETPVLRGICAQHGAPLEAVYVVGARDGALKAAINGLKFSNAKLVAQALAEVLDASLPLFPPSTVIVPVPTVTAHVRQRGYDHIELIARHLGRLREMPVERVLTRLTSDTQHTAKSKEVRQTQAERAFGLDTARASGLAGHPVLLLDDIITTGATFIAAAEKLSQAGAVVYGASLAHQPLD